MVLQTKSIVIVLLASCFLTLSCSKKEPIPLESVNAEELPFMHSEDVSELISDSGIIRYRVDAKVYDMYRISYMVKDRPADSTYTHFPEGIYVERFDTLMVTEGSLRADTAFMYDKSNIWKAAGNVRIETFEGIIFETEELFCDRNAPPDSKEAIFTDKDITLIRDGEVSYHKGLRSNMNMTNFTFYETKAEMIYREKSEPDTLETDTLNTTHNNDPVD